MNVALPYRRSGLVAGLFIVATAMGVVLRTSSSGDLRVTPERMHLYDIPIGEEAPLAWELTNRGVSPVEVQSVQPSCSCTSVEDLAFTIDPGKSRIIRATLHTLGAQEGPTNARVTIKARTQKNTQELILPITAELYRPVQLPPMPLSMQPVAYGVGGTESFDVVLRGKGLQLKRMEFISDNPFLSLDVINRRASDSSERVTVETHISREAPSGPLRAAFQLNSDQTYAPIVIGSIRTEVRGALIARPAEFGFGLVEVGSPLYADASLTMRDKISMQQLVIEAVAAEGVELLEYRLESLSADSCRLQLQLAVTKEQATSRPRFVDCNFRVGQLLREKMRFPVRLALLPTAH
ncbi:DUF1573 domain-containing protein [Candidatus Sumerlaeota bacterium]|nr:DUF1573 domain-containing protein [Candidatus Sumerlaeota bacterium]